MKLFNYKLTPFDFYRIRTVLIISIVTAITTYLYYMATGFINSSSFFVLVVGFKLGAMVGILEEFVFYKMFRKFRLLYMIVFRAFLYMFFVAWMFLGLEFFYSIINAEPILSSFNIIYSETFWYNFLYTLIVIDFLVFFNQTSKLFGHTNLLIMWSGKYRYPVKEDRIFMFIDLVSSTEISGKLERIQYFNLINDFVHDLTVPVLRTSGHIYQYVGDEVVITWKINEGLKNNNCIYMFHLVQETIVKNASKYLKKYGTVPKFKAGIHCGEVITAEIGDLKTEIIHNGEVLNIAARIRSACTDHKRELLISKDLKNKLPFTNDFTTENIGNIILKGVPEPMELFAVESTNKSELYSKVLLSEKVS